MYQTLEISWGGNVHVSIALPTYDDFAASGIEIIKFSSGLQLSLKELTDYFSLSPSESISNSGVVLEDVQKYFSLRDQLEIPLVGTNGDDVLSGNGKLMGRAGRDIITGGDDATVLVGGIGADTLHGGTGSNTYAYVFGDGVDELILNGHENILDLSGGNEYDIPMYPARLKFFQSENNLVIKFDPLTSDQITIEGYFSSPAMGEQNFSILLADGTYLHEADISSLISPAEADEDLPLVIYGTISDDELVGGSANDYLLAASGSDSMAGGQGDDVYTYSTQYVLDATISDEGGNSDFFLDQTYSMETMLDSMERLGDDLVYSPASYFKITFDDFFSDRSKVIEHFVAAYSESRTAADIYEHFGLQLSTSEPIARGVNISGSSTVDVMLGTDGDDVLQGQSGDDILVGLGGNDLLKGGEGLDQFIFAGNFGKDVVDADYSVMHVDSILIKDIDPSSIWFSKAQDDLFIDIAGSPNSIQILNWATSYFAIQAGTSRINKAGVDSLVSEMQQYGPYGQGLVLSAEQQASLNHTINDIWV